MFIPKIPDNDLKPYIEELVYIVERFYAETDEEDRFGMQFKFNAPATDEEINYLETSLNIVVPIGYKEFLKISNGARLCEYTSEFLNIKRVVNLNKMETSPDFPKDYILIADIIGDGEILCFSKNTGKFIRYFDGKEIVYDNFYKFIEWLINFIRNEVEEFVEL